MLIVRPGSDFGNAPRGTLPHRRNFLAVGSLGGLSLASILGGQAARGHSLLNPAKSPAKRVILVFLGGGLSHHDSFDPKPEAPSEIRGNYGTIATALPGVRFGEKLPLLAQQLSRSTLVRSGSHNNDHHETATNWVLSGRFGSPFGDYPAIGAVVAHEKGYTSELPPYVAIPRNPSFTWELGKSAFLGGRYESFRTGDPNQPRYRVEDVDPDVGLNPRRSQRRTRLVESIDTLARTVEKNDQIATFDEFGKRAVDLILSPRARGAFDMEQEPERVRDRFGRNTFGQSCLLARRLIERGVTFATVNYGGWDHHAKIYPGLDSKLPELDRGLSTLIQDLDERGLLSETLLVAMGEFGRTPKINKDAGRDHWGQAASLWFAGAGVARGRVIGSTDKTGAYATRRPVSPADVACTMLDRLGIDPKQTLHTPDGRPLEILDQGEPIRELFS